jgi:pilus assembly protein CpaC
MIFLEGTVEDEAIAKRANNIALLYLPDLRPGNPLERDTTAQRLAQRSLIQSLIVVKPPPPKKEEKLLRITINFVELSKDYNKLFGFQWQPGFTADPQIALGSSGSSGASFTATISSLLPKLYESQTTGFARVLKTGTIIVKNRQPAKLVEQTEFPFATTGANGQMGSSSKAVGLTVGVTPSIIGKTEDIDLDLKLDQTELVGKAPTGSAPVTASHKVDTTIIVKSNESAAIGGLMDNSIGTDFNKDPPSTGSFSQGTDPLFNLLHSKAFRKQKSQFVIFVTPQIIENASDGTEDLKKNFRIKIN